MEFSRRKFLRDSSLVMLSSSLGPLSYAQKFHLRQELHQKIAQRIRTQWLRQNITLKIFYPKGSLGNLKPVVSQFKKLTGIQLQLEEAALDEISSEMILKSRVAKTSGTFDIALPATFGLPDLVEAGVIADLSDYAKKYEPKGFSANSLYSLGDRFKSRLYGYQTDGDAYVMFYNKNWLSHPTEQKRYADKYSRPLEVPKTWQELDRQIRFFHRPEKGYFGGSLFRNKNYIAWEFWIRLHAKGLYPVKDDMTPQIHSAAAVEALNELIETSKFLAPDVKSNGLFENFASFAQGDKFCNLGWGGTQKYLNSQKSKLKDRLSFSPTPGGLFNGQEYWVPYFNWGWNYVVSATSPHKELSYLFTLFASTPQISIYSVREPEGYFDPFRTEHYADPDIQNTYGQDFLAAHRESLAKSIPDFYLRGQGAYLAALKQAVHAAYLRQVSAQRALNDVAKRWQAITQSLGAQSQAEQWNDLKRAYPENLQKILV